MVSRKRKSYQETLDAFGVPGSEKRQKGLELLSRILIRIANSPDSNSKFRRLNLSSNLLQSILSQDGSQELLDHIGFDSGSETHLVLPPTVSSVCCKDFIDGIINALPSKRQRLNSDVLENNSNTNSNTTKSNVNKDTINSNVNNDTTNTNVNNDTTNTNVNNDTTYSNVNNNLKATSNCVELLGTTIFCDACGKARKLPADHPFNLSGNWQCVLLPKLRQKSKCVENSEAIGTKSILDYSAAVRVAACSVPDDEVTEICGPLYASVLERLGCKTRALLAEADIQFLLAAACDDSTSTLSSPHQESKQNNTRNTHTAGDTLEYSYAIQSWIKEAQVAELHDIMCDIIPDFETWKSFLFKIGISTPRDIIDHKPSEICRLLQFRAGIEAPIENTIIEWQQNAKKSIDSYKWLKLWTFDH